MSALQIGSDGSRPIAATGGAEVGHAIVLRRGDVISYSAGSRQDGPDGFRVTGAPNSTLSLWAERWPHLVDALSGVVSLLIHAYPAAMPHFEFGASVDTYVSARTASRALRLAVRDRLPVILSAQPLFAAEVLIRHVNSGHALPACVILITGGYPLPNSLERALQDVVGPATQLYIVQAYGVAEVDSALFYACDRELSGRPRYFTRGDEIDYRIDDGELSVRINAGPGLPAGPYHRTGDFASESGDALLIRNSEESARSEMLALLERWSIAEWRDRTGYLGCESGSTLFQLREGVAPSRDGELDFWSFGARFGFSWLDKPRWGAAREDACD